MLKLPNIKLPDGLKTRITGMGEKLNTQAGEIGEKASKIGQKLNNKKVIMPVVLAVGLILGGLVGWKVYKNKGLINNILSSEKIKEPTYRINLGDKITRKNPWVKGTKIFVLFTNTNGEEYMVEIPYTEARKDYYLAYSNIYPLEILGQKEENYVAIYNAGNQEKTELPKDVKILEGRVKKY